MKEFDLRFREQATNLNEKEKELKLKFESRSTDREQFLSLQQFHNYQRQEDERIKSIDAF